MSPDVPKIAGAAAAGGPDPACYHPAHAKTVDARDAGRGRRHGVGPDTPAHRLGGRRGRGAEAFPDDRPDGHDRPADDAARRREAGRRLPEAGARARKASRRRCSRSSRIARTSSPASRATAASGRCCSWATPTSSTSTRRSGRIRRSAPRARAATSTAAAPSTTRTTSSAALMTMLMLKRLNVPLDRDVIFLAEAGEEGTTRVGIQFMVNQHFPSHRRRVLLCRRRRRHARGRPGEVRLGADAREDPARDRADRARAGRSRLGAAAQTTPIVHLAEAVATVADVEAADSAERNDRGLLQAAGDHLAAGGGRSATATCSAPTRRSPTPPTSTSASNEPRHASMLRTSVSPNIFHGRLPRQRHPVGSDGDARRAHAAGRRPESVPRAGAEGRQRSGDRGRLRRSATSRPGAHRAARHRGVHGDRGQRHASTTSADHAADDEHRRDRHGVPARQGHPVLRRRSGDRHRGRPEGIRRAQRSGADSRNRAASASSASTTTSSRTSPGK